MRLFMTVMFGGNLVLDLILLLGVVEPSPWRVWMYGASTAIAGCSCLIAWREG